MLAVLGLISAASHMYNLNGIKSKTVGDGQHGAARFATGQELLRTFKKVPYNPDYWRELGPQSTELKLPQGVVVGCRNKSSLVFQPGRKWPFRIRKQTYALVDTADVHTMMIGAAGCGKTAFWLYPNLEYACGDAILQKTITIDCIEKVHKKNEGEAPMYYVRDNHPAIVSRKTFNKAQAEMARRGSKRSPSQKGSVTGQGKYSKYALSEVLHCGTCGTKYRRTTWCKNGKKRVVWRCCSRLDYGTQFCKDSPTLDETELHAAIVRAMSTFSKEDYDIFHQSILDTMPDAIGMFEDTSEAGVIKSQIESLNQGMMELVELSIKEGLSVEESEESFQRISEEIAQLEARLEAIRTTGQSENERLEGIQRLQASVNELKTCTSEYNDNAVRQMIECIKVYPTGKLEVIFAGGYTVAEHIDLKKG